MRADVEIAPFEERETDVHILRELRRSRRWSSKDTIFLVIGLLTLAVAVVGAVAVFFDLRQ